jgi:hypothetical protein
MYCACINGPDKVHVHVLGSYFAAIVPCSNVCGLQLIKSFPSSQGVTRMETIDILLSSASLIMIPVVMMVHASEFSSTVSGNVSKPDTTGGVFAAVEVPAIQHRRHSAWKARRWPPVCVCFTIVSYAGLSEARVSHDVGLSCFVHYPPQGLWTSSSFRLQS